MSDHDRPADMGNPCDDCGHSGIGGCEDDPVMLCKGWIPEPAPKPETDEDALERVLPYVIATLAQNNSFPVPGRPDWRAIHSGRAESSIAQLEALVASHGQGERALREARDEERERIRGLLLEGRHEFSVGEYYSRMKIQDWIDRLCAALGQSAGEET